MWVQKDKLKKQIKRDEVLDWVVIDGVLWVEIPDEEEESTCIAQC